MRAMNDSNPAPLGSDAWMENYRVGLAREKRAVARPRAHHQPKLSREFTLLPVRSQGLVAVPELFAHCTICGSALPTVAPAIYWNSCACGNIRLRRFFSWQSLTIRDTQSVEPVKLVGKGSITG